METKLKIITIIIVVIFITWFLALILPIPILAVLVTLVLIACIKPQSFRIAVQTEYGWVDNNYTKNSWNKIPGGLSKLEKAWLYFMCISKSKLISLELTIRDKKYYVYQEVKVVDHKVWRRNGKPVHWEHVADFSFANDHKPMQAQKYKMNLTSDADFIRFANVIYPHIKKVDDVYNLNLFNIQILYK